MYKLIFTVTNQFICIVSPGTRILYHKANVGPMMDSSRRKTEYLHFSLLLRDYKAFFLGNKNSQQKLACQTYFLIFCFCIMENDLWKTIPSSPLNFLHSQIVPPPMSANTFLTQKHVHRC